MFHSAQKDTATHLRNQAFLPFAAVSAQINSLCVLAASLPAHAPQAKAIASHTQAQDSLDYNFTFYLVPSCFVTPWGPSSRRNRSEQETPFVIRA